MSYQCSGKSQTEVFTLPCLHHHLPLTFLEPLYTDSSTTQTNALTGLGYVQMLHKHLF
jgi:hypothetical protein